MDDVDSLGSDNALFEGEEEDRYGTGTGEKENMQYAVLSATQALVEKSEEVLREIAKQ